MNGRHSSIVVAISLVTSAPAFAANLRSPAFTPRELAHCMMKRLRSNTAESYRGALRACQEQLDSAHAERADSVTAATIPETPKH